MKKIVVSGSRGYQNYEEAKSFLLDCINIIGESEITIVSGGAVGADSLGECFAKEKGYPLEIFPAEWKKYGRAAGPIRNNKMAQVADVVCFWDGKSKGTASMISLARKKGKRLFLKMVCEENLERSNKSRE